MSQKGYIIGENKLFIGDASAASHLVVNKPSETLARYMVFMIFSTCDAESQPMVRERPGTSYLVVVFGVPSDMGQVLVLDLAACGFRKQYGVACPTKSGLTTAVMP